MEPELTLLGTGHAMVTKCYNTCFTIKNGGEYFLVDAGGGNGILAQMEKAGIPFSKIHHLFVTHGHTDHVLGVVWALRKITMLMLDSNYTGDLTLYCHDLLADMIKTFCGLTFPKPIKKLFDTRVVFKEVADGDQFNILGLPIVFFDIGSDKTKQYGFQAFLPDRQTLVCLGDEPYKDSSQKYVESCDWLLCEAYCLYEDRAIFKPYEKHHSTVLDASRLAADLHVKKLVLYHTEDFDLTTRKARYTREAHTVYSGKVYVPDDLETIAL